MAAEKRKGEKKGQKENQWPDREENRKDSSLVFQIVIGNQTNPATVAAPGHGRPTGTAPKPSDFTCRLALPSC